MQLTKEKLSYRALLDEPQYLKLLVANIINRFGDSVDAVAFGWLVYQLTGSKEWMTVILGVNLLPTVLLQPFTGAVVNYLNKKWVMVCCDFGRGLLVLSIAVTFVTSTLTPTLLLCITLVNSSLEALRIPCGMMTLRKVLKPENIPIALSLNQTANRAAELIGMGLAGGIIALLGVSGAILIDAITFLGSGVILVFLHIAHDTERASNRYTKELSSGFRYFFSNKIVVLMVFICCMVTFVELPMSSLQAAYIEEGLLLGTDALSIGSAALSIGMLTGSVLYPLLFGSRAGRAVFVGIGVSEGLVYLALTGLMSLPGATTRLVLYGVIQLLFGIVFASIEMAVSITFMQNVDMEFMARAGGLFNSIASASGPMCALLLTVAVSLLSLSTIYLLMGILTIAVFVLLFFSKTMRTLK